MGAARIGDSGAGPSGLVPTLGVTIGVGILIAGFGAIAGDAGRGSGWPIGETGAAAGTPNGFAAVGMANGFAGARAAGMFAAGASGGTGSGFVPAAGGTTPAGLTAGVSRAAAGAGGLAPAGDPGSAIGFGRAPEVSGAIGGSGLTRTAPAAPVVATGVGAGGATGLMLAGNRGGASGVSGNRGAPGGATPSRRSWRWSWNATAPTIKGIATSTGRTPIISAAGGGGKSRQLS